MEPCFILKIHFLSNPLSSEADSFNSFLLNVRKLKQKKNCKPTENRFNCFYLKNESLERILCFQDRFWFYRRVPEAAGL